MQFNSSTNEKGNNLRFDSLQSAEDFKRNNIEHLSKLHTDASKVDGVTHTDTWLNKNCPSFVVGINQDDTEVVCFPV